MEGGAEVGGVAEELEGLHSLVNGCHVGVCSMEMVVLGLFMAALRRVRMMMFGMPSFPVAFHLRTLPRHILLGGTFSVADKAESRVVMGAVGP